MKYVVTAPYAYIYKSAEKDEIADTIFHGQRLDIKDGLAETEYGYSGYIERRSVTRREYEPDYIIRAPAADIVYKPDVKSPPVATLFCGGKIKISGGEDETKDINNYLKITMADGSCGFIRAGAAAPIETGVCAPDRREAVLRAAFMFIGAQYRWGGKTIEGIDCSGLAWISYYINGITIWRDAAIKEGFPVRPIPPFSAKPADLIYFPGHVGLYIGGGKIIHSSFKNNGAAVDSLSEMPAPIAAGTAFYTCCEKNC